MNTALPSDEFDAARAVVNLLKSLKPDEQARALRWANEKLGVNDTALTGGTDWAGPQKSRPHAFPAKADHELAVVLFSPAFAQCHAAVDKTLYLFGATYALKPNAFENVLAIRGRNCRYFGKSSAEILNSGKSTQPKNIPGTEYWVMTNSQTQQKRGLLTRALTLLGFSHDAIRDAVVRIS